jgi:hypothetical protein
VRAAALLALALCGLGCAYGFTYGGGAPDRPTVNVRVEPLVDQTGDGWPAAVVTNRLRERVGSPRGGPGERTLSGEVTQVSVNNLPVARPGGVAAGLMVLRVTGVFRLRDHAGNVVLPDTAREGHAEATVASSVGETEDMRRLAVERAALALADAMADAVMDR